MALPERRATDYSAVAVILAILLLGVLAWLAWAFTRGGPEEVAVESTQVRTSVGGAVPEETRRTTEVRREETTTLPLTEAAPTLEVQVQPPPPPAETEAPPPETTEAPPVAVAPTLDARALDDLSREVRDEIARLRQDLQDLEIDPSFSLTPAQSAFLREQQVRLDRLEDRLQAALADLSTREALDRLREEMNQALDRFRADLRRLRDELS